MDDADRKQLYTSLLHGLAKHCQDSLCAADKHHEWGPIRRFQVKHDYVPRGPVSFNDVCNETYIVAGDRTCLNCGKVEVVK